MESAIQHLFAFLEMVMLLKCLSLFWAMSSFSTVRLGEDQRLCQVITCGRRLDSSPHPLQGDGWGLISRRPYATCSHSTVSQTSSAGQLSTLCPRGEAILERSALQIPLAWRFEKGGRYQRRKSTAGGLYFSAPQVHRTSETPWAFSWGHRAGSVSV